MDTNGMNHAGAGADTDNKPDMPDNMPLAYPPPRPEWTPGKPGFIARRLIKLAGCDLIVALTLPADEQQKLKRVGLGILFGVLLQFILIYVGITVWFGQNWWAIPLSGVIEGVLFSFDTKMVAADWLAQGRRLCQRRGLLPPASVLEWFERPLVLIGRYLIGTIIVFVAAAAVLMAMFRPDIEEHWARQNEVQNRPIVEAITAQLAPRIASLEHQLTVADAQVVEAEKNVSVAREVPPLLTADIDTQLQDRIARIKVLETAKAEAEGRRVNQRGGLRAEKWGRKVVPGDTGNAGKGNAFHYHREMAEDNAEDVAGYVKEIEAANNLIIDLRHQKAVLVDKVSNEGRGRLEAAESRLNEALASRSSIMDDLRGLREKPADWISAQVRKSPQYVPMPGGIIDMLKALGEIAVSDVFTMTFMLSVKGVILVLESAGLLSKLLFTGSSMYAETIALRHHDIVEYAIDCRMGWDHWRTVRRDRSREAIEQVRQRQEQRKRTRKSYNEIFSRL